MTDISLLPIIGITMGDPVGIGPEILVKAFEDGRLYDRCRPIAIGDAGVITQALDLLKSKLKLHCVDNPMRGAYQSGTLDLLDVSCLNMDCSALCAPTPETGSAMQAYIIKGIDLALHRDIDALVTCPINKTGLKLARSDFHGHTELLAHRTKAEDYAMMMAGSRLKVVLVTIHIPLSQVSESLTADLIIKRIRLTDSALKERFGIAVPQIAVAGLNPHSGESSMFGTEEEAVISPAVESAQSMGISVTGPLPPDTVFHQAFAGHYDAVVCMYHDQGLIPFKLVHFKDGVNTTLGLPIIRTSVDHGTAYDIAWQGKADHSSLMEAIKMAVLQAGNQKRQ